jgi:uncharacterized paraquat-inducible protein A
MISLSIENSFIVYLFVWLITIAILWIREIWRNYAYDWSLSKDQLLSCKRCHYSFLSKHGENVSRCPRCNEICIKRKPRRF